jgi:hypothetical protein
VKSLISLYLQGGAVLDVERSIYVVFIRTSARKHLQTAKSGHI